MKIRIKHRTRYSYDRPVVLFPQVVRLRPADHTRARILSYNLAFSPEGEVRWQHDPWGNRIARLTFVDTPPTEAFEVTVDAAVEISPVNPFDFFIQDPCDQVPFEYPAALGGELKPFLDHQKPGPLLEKWLSDLPLEGSTIDYLVALNQKVARTVNYVIRNDPGVQTSEETLEKRIGSCRDSAILLADALRARGMAARFVSGYLVQLADEGNIPDLAKGIDRDVVDLHAWAEVYLPGAGWIGLDGTSGLLTGEGHIPLACSIDPLMAAPLSGSTGVAESTLDFEMKVARLGHEPRPRRPYTEEQWKELLATGARVDESLHRRGLRMTMGGEPTWVSRKFAHEPEWNNEALGPTKWSQGLLLASELSRRLGHGPLVMQRMGKQYPGESLPRWVLHLLWRKDEVPIWRDKDLLILESPDTGPRTVSDLDRDIELARHFGARLSHRLDVPDTWIDGFEDPWHFLKEEELLPEDIDPLSADLDESEERRRLARVLSRGLGRRVGFAQPLTRIGETWLTSQWTFRRRHMYLVPGDSPMGLRLPLGRTGGVPVEAWAPEAAAEKGPLGFDPRQARRMRSSGEGDVRGVNPQSLASPDRTVRTALCVEPRDGVLWVFLPPVATTDDFLELVASIEDTAREVGTPVGIEGYPPPPDWRMQSCLVTPDPGVIEVNLPVSETFDEYVDVLSQINDAALWAGLSTEKYQIDGRETGSGGGNHLTLGGANPWQSPFLTHPHLLGSMVRYIQNHPSLSYLFSGLFVGPTSQAPRVDEARHDSLYELDIALRQIPGPQDPAALPWKIDRLLRNLLVDLTGSTHRSEICIDKLYSPAGPSGRQGLVELRAFEMPPHERMAAAQMLLARSMIARFAHEPYERPLIRWGSELHDRFLLPHYMWSDLKEVLADLAHDDVSLDPAWFQPFLDYRFPVYGSLELDNILIEARAALEPWPVLGEEPTGATVSRYVDSSMERLQIRVDGQIADRYQVLVNGLELPMRPTGRAGERVAGVRFRAWQPAHCYQPDIGVHHPIHVDLVDTWGKRSLGAFTYHVWHPEGRAFEHPPLTAFEAAARRSQRFTRAGHLPYPVEPVPTSMHPDQPYTLDLRRYPIDRRIRTREEE